MPLPDFPIPGKTHKSPAPGAGLAPNPVESIQKKYLTTSEIEKLKRSSALHGRHASLRLLLERNVLAQQRRLPCLKSNLLGLSESMGLEDDFGPEDLYYQPDECPVLRPGVSDVHSAMESRLGLSNDLEGVTNVQLTSDAFKSLAHSMTL